MCQCRRAPGAARSTACRRRRRWRCRGSRFRRDRDRPAPRRPACARRRWNSNRSCAHRPRFRPRAAGRPERRRAQGGGAGVRVPVVVPFAFAAGVAAVQPGDADAIARPRAKRGETVFGGDAVVVHRDRVAPVHAAAARGGQAHAVAAFGLALQVLHPQRVVVGDGDVRRIDRVGHEGIATAMVSRPSQRSCTPNSAYCSSVRRPDSTLSHDSATRPRGPTTEVRRHAAGRGRQVPRQQPGRLARLRRGRRGFAPAGGEHERSGETSGTRRCVHAAQPTPAGVGMACMFTAVASFHDPIEAHIACGRLRAEGIDAHVADTHMGPANWEWRLTVGGTGAGGRTRRGTRAPSYATSTRAPTRFDADARPSAGLRAPDRESGRAASRGSR